MHKLTINVPDSLIRPIKVLAMDNDTNIGKIVTAHFQEIVKTGKVPDAATKRGESTAPAVKAEPRE